MLHGSSMRLEGTAHERLVSRPGSPHVQAVPPTQTKRCWRVRVRRPGLSLV